MTKTANERKAAERERHKALGRKPVQVWVQPADRPKVVRYAEQLNRRAARQEGGGSADAK